MISNKIELTKIQLLSSCDEGHGKEKPNGRKTVDQYCAVIRPSKPSQNQ